MISLLLTLFISMLSIGSPISRLEESSESRISTISNESFIFDDYKNIKNAFNDNVDGSLFFGLGDITGSRALLNFIYYCNDNYDIDDNMPYSFDNSYEVTHSWFKNSNYPNPYQTIGNFSVYNTTTNQPFGRSYNFNCIRFRKTILEGINKRYYLEFGNAYTNSTSDFTSIVTVMFTVMPNLYNSQYGDYVITDNTIEIDSSINSAYPNYFIGYIGYTQETYPVFEYSRIFGEIFSYLDTFNYNDVYNSGYSSGVYTGYQQGFQAGYQQGLSEQDYDSTALTIFSGIMGIALTPINMFLQIFNFEILGINLAGLISGILTLAVVVIIIRVIVGGKKDD